MENLLLLIIKYAPFFVCCSGLYRIRTFRINYINTLKWLSQYWDSPYIIFIFILRATHMCLFRKLSLGGRLRNGFLTKYLIQWSQSPHGRAKLRSTDSVGLMGGYMGFGARFHGFSQDYSSLSLYTSYLTPVIAVFER